MPSKKQSVKKQAPRKSLRDYARVFVPPVIGVAVILVLAGVFNSQLITAKFKNTQPVLSQSDSVTADQELQSDQLEEDTQPTIRISKISVIAPIAYNNIPEDEEAFQAELRYGVVHYPNTALPGNPGNSVIFGHSSGVWWAAGDYKFIFSQLDKLENGDKIFIDFDSKRYMYEVTAKRVVEANDVSVLQPTNGYNLTLLTCFPVGSDKQRLVVTAKQVIPDPTLEAQTQAQQTAPTAPAAIDQLPGKPQSVWDSIRSIF